jgi:uncharacterized protein YjhX (UPF0386 family)
MTHNYFNYLGNKVEMYSVTSSNVAEVGYDAKTKTVLVKFLNKSLYAYKGVDESVFKELKTASSVGSHLNRNFKKVYSYTKVQ